MVWSPPRVSSRSADSSEELGAGLDLENRLADVEGVDRDVAGICHLLHRERRDVLRRVVGP